MKKIRILIVLLVSTLVFQPALLAQPNSLEGFDEFVESVMKEWKVPGLAVAVSKDGHIVLAKVYGRRNVEEQFPVNKDTLSASKHVMFLKV